MPVYILHGFRWPRAGFTGIRVHIIVNNLEDASAEYIQTPSSQKDIIESFHKAFPQIMTQLPKGSLHFIEQYDPDDLTSDNAVSQPFAYVADKVITMAAPGEALLQPGTPDATKSISRSTSEKVKPNMLGVNVEDVIAEGSGLSAKGWDAFADLRDAIAPGEKIGWWIVYNGDPARDYDDLTDEEEYNDVDDGDYRSEEEEETTPTEQKDEESLTALPQIPSEPKAAPKRGPKPGTASLAAQQSNPNTTSQLSSTVRQPAPLPIRTGPSPTKGPKPKLKTTPFEDQKSPLRDTTKDPIFRQDPEPRQLQFSPETKKLPPIPPQKKTDKATPQRPKTPVKPDTLKKIFGRKIDKTGT